MICEVELNARYMAFAAHTYRVATPGTVPGAVGEMEKAAWSAPNVGADATHHRPRKKERHQRPLGSRLGEGIEER